MFGPGRRTSAGRGNGRKKGGCFDRRRLWLDLDNARYLREQLDFPNAQIALRVDRDVIDANGTLRSSDTRYFLTSLDPECATARELLAAVRAHWQIENSLFFIKDRWWDEDRHWTRRPGVAEWFTQLTTAAIVALRTLGPPQLPIRARADHIAWNPTLGLNLLLAE